MIIETKTVSIKNGYNHNIETQNITFTSYNKVLTQKMIDSFEKVIVVLAPQPYHPFGNTYLEKPIELLPDPEDISLADAKAKTYRHTFVATFHIPGDD